VATSHQDADGHAVVGTSIDASTLAQVHALRSEQDYCVTPFAPTVLYGDRPTYIYHAAIRHPDDDTVVVGGIGIVFDAETEFLAMLRGGLGNKSDANALFVDRAGTVISSTDLRRPVGSTLDIDPALLSLPNGSSGSRIVLHDGHYAIMGCTASHGYREFKVSDGYREDVLAVVFSSFGEVRERLGAGIKGNAAVTPNLAATGNREFATFFVDATLFALPAEHVLEALPASQISSVSRGNREARIGLLGLQHQTAGQGSVWVYDLGYLIHNRPATIAPNSQVIIVRHGGQTFGLLVDALHGVPEFNASQIMPNPFVGHPDASLVKQLIKANGGQLLIHAVDISSLVGLLTQRELAA
jgi:chemotaxis signal transduction protein